MSVTKRSNSRVIGVVLTAVLVVSLFGGTAAAAGKGPGTASAAPAGSQCHALKHSAHAVAADEFYSCVSVGASLSAVPAVGQTATLHVSVKASAARHGAVTDVDLPSNLQFVTAPGMAQASVASVDGIGTANRASRTDDLSPATPKDFSMTVKAVAPGFGQIRVRSTAPGANGGTDAGDDAVFVTVGTTAAASHFGQSVQPLVNGVAPAGAGAPNPTPDTPNRPAKTPPGLPVAPAPSAPAVANTPGTACVNGIWSYYDQNSVLQPAWNTVVQVVSGSTVLASQFAASDGSYSMCWGSGGVTQNVTVLFIEDNALWKVVDNNNNDLRFAAGVSVPDGQTHALGSLVPGDSSLNRGVHAYEEANDEWQWDPTSGCWDPDDSSCRQLSIIWYATSVDGTYWNGAVHLAANNPNAPITVAHEVAHNLMYNLYDGYFPSAPNCNPHSIFGTSSAGCAWTEGFAEFVPASVYNDPNFRWDNGAVQPLDTPTWNDGNVYGDTAEGRVAGAMIDIADYGTEPHWDNYGEGGGLTDGSTVVNELISNSIAAPNTFADFWNGRAALGLNTAQNGALASVYQNTIDYGFRNPLGDYVPLNLSLPTPHNYSQTTHTNYWSAVAVRPSAGSDYDLYQYADFNQTSLLASSAYGGNTTDFVAVDSNRHPLATYYPRVTQFVGTGSYDIELAQGNEALSAGSAAPFMGSADVAHIWDSFQTAGVPVSVRVVPNAGQSGQVLLLADDPATPSTWVQGRPSAVASSGVSAGGEFGLTYTPTTTEWHGLLLLNASGSGTYSVYVDNHAPTGTIAINGGAATTVSANVSLQLSASATSGVDLMQISTDGNINDGAVVPYATTASATLPGPNGVNTVLVRYRNQAGMWSSVYSAGINLQVPPVLTSAAPINGTTLGGTTVTLTGSHLNGATTVSFGSTTVPATVVNDSTVTAVSPAHAAGPVKLKVTTPAGTSNTVNYKYLLVPVISSVTPKRGPLAGGQAVTITGTNFTGATAVKFGTVPATNLVVVSATKITVTSPAHVAANVDVRVTTPTGGTSPTGAADRYAYQGAPTITSVTPATGTHLGGQSVTIIGTNFTGATAVKFGTVAGTAVVVVSGTKITVTTPAHVAGTVDVRVTTPNQTSAVAAADHYQFT